MKLLVVILNYKTPEMTLDALKASYAAIEEIPDARIDIVDNDSRDGSFEKIALGVSQGGYPEARVRVLASPRNGGFGAGNNFAMRAALDSADPPEFIYIQNSDAFPELDAITTLLKFLETRPEVGIAGSRIAGTDGEPHVSAFRFPSLASELERGLALGVVTKLLEPYTVPIIPRPSHTRQVDWLAGASMMVRAEVLRQIGLFDETFFLYFEETDLCRRARLAGWTTWYVVESRCAHVGSASTGMRKWKRTPTYWFDSRKHYFEKNHGKRYFQVTNAVYLGAYSLFKARAAVQGKEDSNPPRFYEDFVRYNFLGQAPRKI